MNIERMHMSSAELEAESATLLPDKQVISLLNLDLDLDLALDLAAPIDLAVAANAQAALPINASVSADVLTVDSTSAAQAVQGAEVNQSLSGEAVAEAPQTALVVEPGDGGDNGGSNGGDNGDNGGNGGDNGGDNGGGNGGNGGNGGDSSMEGGPAQIEPAVAELIASAGNLLEDGLLNVTVDVSVDAAADGDPVPVAGAVAANANVAAPINAAASANIGTIGSESVAVANQTVVINQVLDDVTATALADQDATVIQ